MKARTLIIGVLAGAALGAGGFFALSSRLSSPRIVMTGPAVVTRVQELGKLETASYSIEKIVEAGGDSGSALKDFFFGDKLLLVADGDVVAGVDLTKVTASDVQVQGTRVQVTLPKAEILRSGLDDAKTRVFDRKLGLLARPDKDLESDARRSAETAITQAACAAGILDTAAGNAKKELRALFEALGFTDIAIDAPPASC